MPTTTLALLTDPRLRQSTPAGPGGGSGPEFWTTLEGENPGGSIKDRMVLPELERALKTGELRPGDTVSEISAGSTALSLAYHAARLGLGCRLFIPDGTPAEARQKLTALGAQLTLCNPETAYQRYDEFLLHGGCWPLHQMKNPRLRDHYRRWLRQCREETPHFPRDTGLVVGAVGTGHSLLGAADALNVPCWAAEPRPGEPVMGVRNLTQLNFGPEDPCDLSLLQHRREIGRGDYFPDGDILSDLGPLQVSDSFRLALGAALQAAREMPQLRRIFVIGSHNRRFVPPE